MHSLIRPGLVTLLALCAGFLPRLAAAQPTGDLLYIGGGLIHVHVAPDSPLPKPVIMNWVRNAATAVSGYLGRYPVNDVSITIEPGGESAIGGGLTRGGSSISVRLGRDASERDLQHDWVMTHEMFHLAFPTLSRRYLWMMEGLSDYLEPLARARAGQIRPQDAWREYFEGLPQGLPQDGDGGLDGSRDRDRIYWGGNLYWLLADIKIREATGNRHSVNDAIRAILAEGGNGGATWTLQRVLKVGDKATGTTVLKDLYEDLAAKPGTVDLPALWKRLGVAEQRHRIVFDDGAPLAAIRASITAKR